MKWHTSCSSDNGRPSSLAWPGRERVLSQCPVSIVRLSLAYGDASRIHDNNGLRADRTQLYIVCPDCIGKINIFKCCEHIHWFLKKRYAIYINVMYKIPVFNIKLLVLKYPENFSSERATRTPNPSHDVRFLTSCVELSRSQIESSDPDGTGIATR